MRLLINYNKSHKAVVRVSPRVPLEMLLPVVCDKCEFKIETTILLRDSQSTELLDLTKSLNEHGLREVFAKDTAGRDPADHQDQPKTPEAGVLEETFAVLPLASIKKKKLLCSLDCVFACLKKELMCLAGDGNTFFG